MPSSIRNVMTIVPCYSWPALLRRWTATAASTSWSSIAVADTHSASKTSNVWAHFAIISTNGRRPSKIRGRPLMPYPRCV